MQRPGRPILTRPNMWWSIGLATAVMAVGTNAGCAKALFIDDAARTQFDTYQRMRQIYVPTEEPDVFGNPQPALRARLSNR